MVYLTNADDSLHQHRQAGAEIGVTPEMVEEVASILRGWYSDEVSEFARDVVTEVWLAMNAARAKAPSESGRGC